MLWAEEEKQTYRKAHSAAMPMLQKRHNLPHADLKAYFDLLYPCDTGYNGMVTIAKKEADTGAMKLVRVVPVEKLQAWIQKMHVSTRLDYYYSRCQHSGNATWGENRAFAHNAVYVDVDSHEDVPNADRDNRVIQLITAMLPEFEIACPNVIEHTGRGFHLVWVINQVSAKLGWMVKAVSQFYAQTIRQILQDHFVDGYGVDLGYAANICGLTRLPGTYNTASCSYARFDILHRVRDDLQRAYELCSPTTHRGIRCKGCCAAQRRLDALLKLAELYPIEVGYRDKYSLILFCTAKWAGLEDDTAMDLVLRTNAAFPEPLTEKAVRAGLSTAREKRYRYTTDRILEELDITGEMQEAIGLCGGTKRDSNRARTLRNAEKKEQRNQHIISLFEKKIKLSKIAEIVGNSLNTVKKVIREFEAKRNEGDTAPSEGHLAEEKRKALPARLQGTVKKRSAIYCASKALLENLERTIQKLYCKRCRETDTDHTERTEDCYAKGKTKEFAGSAQDSAGTKHRTEESWPRI